MASKIVYKGVSKSTPGVYLKVNAAALAPPVGASSSGMAIIGSAVGGIPASSDMTTDDFADAFYVSNIEAEVSGAGRRYKSGDLREAANALKLVGSAPSPLYLVKVGADVPASLTRSGTYGSAFVLTSQRYGTIGNADTFNMVADSGGHLVTMNINGQEYSQAGVGGDVLASISYTESASDGWDTMKAAFTDAGFVAHATRDVTTTINSATFSPAGTTVSVTWTSGDNGNEIVLFGLDDSNAAQYEVIAMTAGASPATSRKLWNKICGAKLATAAAGAVTVADSDATAQVTFSAADTRKFCTSGVRMYVQDGHTLSAYASNTTAAANLLVYGLNTSGAPCIELISLNDTTPVEGSRTSWSEIREIITGGVTDALTVTIAAMAATMGDPTTSKLSDLATFLNAKTGFSATMTGPDLLLSNMDYTNSASIKTTAADFKADLYFVGQYISSLGVVDYEKVDWVPQVETITWSNGNTGTFVLNGVTFAVADAPAGVTAIQKYTSGSSDLRFIVSATSTGTGSGSVLTITGLQPQGFTLTESDGDIVAASVSAVAGQSSLTGVDSSTVFNFVGGGTTDPTVNDYTTALTLLRDFDLNSIVVLSGDPDVHAALAGHLDYMAGLGFSERQGFVGLLNAAMDDVPTKTEIRSQIRDLDNRNITAVAQALTWADASGVQTEWLPYMVAVLFAAVEISQPLGSPITHKTLGRDGRVTFGSYLRGDNATWTPRSDSDEMINLGLTFCEKTPQGIIRVVRHVTTYLTDDNIAYVNGSVNRVVNFMCRDIRTAAQAYVGAPGVKRTLVQLLGQINGRLRLRVKEEIITGYTPATGVLELDVATVTLGFAPTVDINFIIPDLTLQAGNISA